MDAVGEHLLVANMMRMIFDGGGDLCFICNIINVTIDGIVIRLEIIIDNHDADFHDNCEICDYQELQPLSRNISRGSSRGLS